MKKIFYVLNNNKDPNFSSSIEIINFIKKQKAVIYTDDKLLAEKANINIVNEIDLEVIDLAIVLGGDGTMLKYYRFYGKYNIPTLGINNGRIGALAIVNLNDYKEKISKYFNDEYMVVKPAALEVIVKKFDRITKFIVYNDITIYRGLSLKMLPIGLKINSSASSSIYADGVVVATATGSSAYNLSAGGPLLALDSGCYVVTPICSQAHAFPSVVLTYSDVCHLKVENDAQTVLSVDGSDMIMIDKDDEIEIKISNQKMSLVQFSKGASLYGAIYKVVSRIHGKEE